LVVAIIAGIVALVSAAGTIWSSIRNAERSDANARAIAQLKFESDRLKLAAQRDREIANFKEPLARAAYDLQSRIFNILKRNVVDVQSGTGADITMAIGNWPQLYAESLADVGDVAVGKAQGGYYDVSKLVATVGNKWIGVPWAIVGGLVAYRKSWFDEIGYDTFPDTWDALLDAGRKLKAKGRPIGQTAGHTFGDAPAWWYPYLWSWGGKEVEADGKTVVLNSRKPSNRSSSRLVFGKTPATRVDLPGTTPTTTGPSCRVPSAPPTTALRSTLKPSANPRCI
jgi:hypothetical protein